MEIRVDIDTRELADDGMFCDIVGDIAADVVRDSGEVQSIVSETLESDIGYYIEQHIQCSSVLDPDDDDFIKTVAKAILNMARSYVGE